MEERAPDLDVLIVGAGLSGISAAYHLGARCPQRSYAILEARACLGGTWDLFRYPGVRSDSDMYTLGYRFKPWNNARAIADGAAILAYVREAAAEFGIDRKIRYGQRMEGAAWSTQEQCWTVSVRDGASGALSEVRCRFLYLCTGYYAYDAGYTPNFAGRELFQGRIVHPQEWTPEIAYEGLKVVVIGSGATAVTLVPELAKRAAHVTMLQRSPTYIVSAPSRDRFAEGLRRILPRDLAYAAARWRYVLLGMAFFIYCRMAPRRARRTIMGWVKAQLRGKMAVEPHFAPTYNPWDQRLCLVPDGDLFAALRDGRASVVTDQIDSFTPTGIRLKSGSELSADLVVTATGLRLQLVGGASFEVDGKSVELSRALIYRGSMASDTPNLVLAIGYTNASWTLKCDLTAEYVCRLLNHMEANGYVSCCPRPKDREQPAVPVIDFTSGYIQRALNGLPRQGARAPWRLRQNYILDLLTLRYGSLEVEMEFTTAL